MKDETKQAIQNYTREVRGRVAHRIDNFFDKRGELSDDVSVEVARFIATEAADSVNCFLFVDVENIGLEEAKLFICGACDVKDEQVTKAVNHFRKRLSLEGRKKGNRVYRHSEVFEGGEPCVHITNLNGCKVAQSVKDGCITIDISSER